MLVGCFPFNTLLQSTLECFYDSNCLQLLQSVAAYNHSEATQFLYNSSISRFPPNATIQTMVNELFIEQWVGESNYTAFYIQCQPSLCTYAYVSKGGIATAVATIIGLFGSLSLAMKTAAPIIVYLYCVFSKKWIAVTRKRIVSVNQNKSPSKLIKCCLKI